MAAYLDIVGSVVIGGMLLATVLSLNASLIENSYTASMELSIQTELRTVTTIMERDLKNMGYRVRPALITAGSDSILFKGDLNDNGSPDSVAYYLGGKEQVLQTENPNDRPLIRKLNGVDELLSTRATSLRFLYFDEEGKESEEDSIRTIQVSVTVESPYRYGGDYTKAVGRFKVSPRNLSLE